MKHLKRIARTFWFWTFFMGAVFTAAFLWDACDSGVVSPTAPEPVPAALEPETPTRDPVPRRGPAVSAFEQTETAAAQTESVEEQAGRRAIYMAASAEAVHGAGWRDGWPTREELSGIFEYQEQNMTAADFRLFKAAVEIVMNPAELEAWKRRLGPVDFSPERIQQMRDRRERFEQWQADYKRRVLENRKKIREQGGGSQGPDMCGGGLPAVQDDADCDVCDDECWQEEAIPDIQDTWEYHYTHCCNSQCPTCSPGWCGP